MKRNRTRAFTLIEILVSISLAGILAALAIPNYREARGRSYDATVQSDMRNIKTALYAAASERSSDGLYYVSTTGSNGFWLSFDVATNQISTGSFNANEPFPEPLQGVRKSKGVNVLGAYEYTLNGVNYVYTYVTHERSKHRFYEYQSGNNQQKFKWPNF